MDASHTKPAPDFNLLSPDFIRDPYPHYRRLREYDPIWRSPFGYVVSTRRADIDAILRDKRFGRDFIGRMEKRYGENALAEPALRLMSRWMLSQDPPDHTRLRGLVVKAFTARRVADMRPTIQDLVDQTIDSVEPRGHLDLIADFAFRLPVIVICKMLGIPDEDRDLFLVGSRASGRLIDPIPMSRAELDETNLRIAASRDYFQRLFELRRSQPRDDLISRLIEAEEHGQKLTEEELIANIVLLFGAGHETTVNLIGNGILALYRNPDQLKLLRERPELIGNAVEEILRYDSSAQTTYRSTLEDATVGGVAFKRGDAVLCLLGAGNRDPEFYADPDRLDITRTNPDPLSFGGGIHHCLGAQLARLEGEIAISTLLRRLPGLTLDDPDNPQWRPTFVLHGLTELPASW
jgi:cytochrome P450